MSSSASPGGTSSAAHVVAEILEENSNGISRAGLLAWAQLRISPDFGETQLRAALEELGPAVIEEDGFYHTTTAPSAARRSAPERLEAVPSHRPANDDDPSLAAPEADAEPVSVWDRASLTENRAGRLGSAERGPLERRELGGNLILGLFGAWLLVWVDGFGHAMCKHCPSSTPAGPGDYFFATLIGVPAVFWCVFRLWETWLDLRAATVNAIEGASGKHKVSGKSTSYYLDVGGRHFHVPRGMFDVAPEGGRVRVYFLPRTGDAINFESIEPQDLPPGEAPGDGPIAEIRPMLPADIASAWPVARGVRWRPASWTILAVVVVVGLLLSLFALTSSNGGSGGQTLSGTVELDATSSFVVSSDEKTCQGTGFWGYLHGGMPIALQDGANVIGRTTVQPGVVLGGHCSFAFQFEGAPTTSMYSVVGPDELFAAAIPLAYVQASHGVIGPILITGN